VRGSLNASGVYLPRSAARAGHAAPQLAMRTDLPKPPDVGSIFARQKALNETHETLTAKRQQLENEARFKRGEAEPVLFILLANESAVIRAAFAHWIKSDGNDL
jgi:hypothetical protein